MSKKKNDQNFISELLGKLKASYSEPEKKIESQKAETEDSEFQKKLEEMLNKASVPTASTEKENVELLQESEDLREEEPQVTSKPKKKRSSVLKKSKPKIEEPQEEIPAPVELETSLEKPLIEESISADAEVLDTKEPMQEEAPSVPLAQATEEHAFDAPQNQEAERPDESIAETIQEEPEEIPEENISLPPESKARDFGKSKPPVSSETIVIRPKTSHQPKQETIVIRPRVQSKPTPTPQKITESAQKEPIRIGKDSNANGKATSSVKRSPVSNTQTEKRTHSVTRVPLSSAGSSATESTEKKAASSATSKDTTQRTVKKVPGVTVPGVKKKSRPSETPTFLKNTEDEQLDVALDTVISADLESDLEINASEDIQNEPLLESRPAKAGKTLSFSDQIHQKTGLTDEDVDLLFELGYENELSNLVGTENLKKLKSAHLRKKRQSEEPDYPTALGYRGKEYTGDDSQESILAAYLHDRKYLLIRLILTALSALCLLFIEVPALRGTYWTTIDQAIPWLLPIIGILLLISSAALSAKQLLTGAKMLIQFTPSPYSVCGVLLIPALVYDIIAIFSTSLHLPVNFLISLALLITVLCDVFRLCGEMKVFRVLSDDGIKNVLETVTLRKKKMKHGDKIVKILNDDVGESFYRIAQTKATTGFFRRFNTMYGASRPFAVLILSSMGLSILLAFAVAIKTQSFSQAITSFMTFLLIGTPLSAIFGFFYPLFHANRLLTQHQCALVGEESVEEYCEPKTVIFEDKDMFHTEKCTEIAINESDDFQTDMKLASALFRKIGSTLDPIGKATAKQVENLPVALVRVTETGTEATVNNHHLLAGDAAFFKKSGIRIPKESSDRVLRRTENVKVMYVAIDGVLKLSYEIEYTEKATFEKMAESLLESNTSVAIRSYDPNLNSSFVQEIRKGKLEPIRVIKPGRHEENSVLNLVDTGAVSLNEPEKTVCALHAAAKIEKTRRFTMRMQLIATLLGSGAALLLTLLGNSNFFGIAQITLYHIFWMLVSLISAHLEITEEKLHLLK